MVKVEDAVLAALCRFVYANFHPKGAARFLGIGFSKGLPYDVRKYCARKTPCWVCGTETPLVTEAFFQSTLGLACSGEACQDCQRMRAAPSTQVRGLFFRGGSPPPESGYESVMNIIDADGKRSGKPVHVCDGGEYVRLRDWLKDHGFETAPPEGSSF